MRYTIRLCGGPAEGRIITITHLPPMWRVPVVRAAGLSAHLEDDNSAIPAVIDDEVHYHNTGIRTVDGVHLYVTSEILEQLIDVIARLRPDPPRVDAGREEGILPRSCWEPAIAPGMSGKREYPWDAIKREDTERLLNKIDEVTDGEN